ncbi:hypothetical protein AC579_4960 [Pseudocercospora musae]|uniref:Uncharacterized protein n=1 Tax=Pseudocercospora musae TaxID=113226 RepID=A0A139I6M2_9PEZI|nr:hypothetical protein AC579_4960 [Pseudocercospora musae]
MSRKDGPEMSNCKSKRQDMLAQINEKPNVRRSMTSEEWSRVSNAGSWISRGGDLPRASSEQFNKYVDSLGLTNTSDQSADPK